MKRLIILLLFASPLFAQDQIIDHYFPYGISDSTVWVFDCKWDNGKIASIVTKDNWWYFPLNDYDHDIHPFHYRAIRNVVGYSAYSGGYGGYEVLADFNVHQGDQFITLFGNAGASVLEYGKCISTDTTVITNFDTLNNCYLFNVGATFTVSSSIGGIYYAPGIGFASPNLAYAKIGSKEYGQLPDGMTQRDLRNPITSIPNVKEQNPESFNLAQNYPNPFNSETVIEFNLPQFSEINLAVYDVSGREIKTILSGQLPPGAYSEKWDGTDNSGNAVASGVYFIRLKSGQYSKFIKTVYSK